MEYIEIGKIVNTHGLKGELKIESWSSFDEIRYAKGNTVFLKIDNKYVPFAVEFTNGAQDNLRVRTSEGKEFLVPYVDEFILDVNLDENYIQIHLMDGLL